MRRFVGITMPVLMFLAFITGIIESQPFHSETPGLHIFLSVLLLLSSTVHLHLSWKPFSKYFKSAKYPVKDPMK